MSKEPQTTKWPLQFVWWGLRNGWWKFFMFSRPQKNGLMDIYDWYIHLGPLEVRKWKRQ